jgi:hypothetical protein
MAMNKKGMFFTVIAIAFIVVFIFAFTFNVGSRLTNQMQITESRISSINEFILDLERDTERGLYISSYRALLAVEEYIINQGEFVDDVEVAFEELLINGTINGTSLSLIESSTFTQWTSQVSSEGDNFNLNVNVTPLTVNLVQQDPWNVLVTVNVSYYVEDSAQTSSWNYSKGINTTISIINFEDPLYVVNSLGRLTNTIQTTPYEGNYTYESGGNWYVDNLVAHINQSYYAENTNAPSFLMRLENNLSASENGIESMVNLKKVSDFGLTIDTDASIIDYLYWNDDNNGNYRINDTVSWVRFDLGHLANYDLTAFSYLD